MFQYNKSPTFTVHYWEVFDILVKKASLNSSFNKLNPCSARDIALSQLDAPTILVRLITFLVDTGKASSICFESSCSSCAFSIRVYRSILSGIVFFCAIMVVTKGEKSGALF